MHYHPMWKPIIDVENLVTINGPSNAIFSKVGVLVPNKVLVATISQYFSKYKIISFLPIERAQKV